MARVSQSYDARIYTICTPWKGDRGDPYLRVFKPAFLNGLGGVSDEYCTLRKHVEGTDPGGNNGGRAHGGGAPGVKSQDAYDNRSSKLKSLLIKHITNPAINAAIERTCADLLVVAAAGNPLPLGAPAGTSEGQMALLVADSFGNLPTTGLTEETRDAKWTAITLRQVGYTPESMLNLKLLIDQTSAERPVAKTPEQCRTKFLLSSRTFV